MCSKVVWRKAWVIVKKRGDNERWRIIRIIVMVVMVVMASGRDMNKANFEIDGTSIRTVSYSYLAVVLPLGRTDLDRLLVYG